MNFTNVVVILLAMYFLGALWYIAFQSDPVVVGISTLLAIVIVAIKERKE